MKKLRKNIRNFANQHKIIFDDKGECGIGRECVGLRDGNHWIDYNPWNQSTCENIEKYFDQRLEDIKPPDAYDKHDCIAVLGRGDKAIKQLSDWVDKLRELNVNLVDVETGARGIQILFSGFMRKAFVIPSSKD